MAKAKYFTEGCKKLMSFQSQNCETSRFKREKHNGYTSMQYVIEYLYWACIILV
jgi:hypothetical protein